MHCGKQSAYLYIEIHLYGERPYNPAVWLVGIYPEKNIIWKDTCTAVFIAAVFTVAYVFINRGMEKEMATHSSVLAWRIPGMGEPGGLLSMGSKRVRHDWSDLAAAAAAVVHVYNAILLSHKKKWKNAICSNVDGPRNCHTEWSKSEKDKYPVVLFICGI